MTMKTRIQVVDVPTMTNDAFLKSLSEAELDEAEAIEAELCGQLREGLSENNALHFVRTTMTVRKTVPNATVDGIFEYALSTGLSHLDIEIVDKKPIPIKRRKLVGKGTK